MTLASCITRRAVTTNQEPVTTLLPPSKTIQFKLCIGNPSSYRARFNSIQRNNSSMSNRKHHLSLEPREVWICDMFANRFNISSVAFYICIYSLPHLVCYINKYNTYKSYQSISLKFYIFWQSFHLATHLTNVSIMFNFYLFTVNENRPLRVNRLLPSLLLISRISCTTTVLIVLTLLKCTDL